MLPDVLDQLVRTGRAVPESLWIGSVIAADKRKELTDKFKNAGIKPGVVTAAQPTC